MVIGQGAAGDGKAPVFQAAKKAFGVAYARQGTHLGLLAPGPGLKCEGLVGGEIPPAAGRKAEAVGAAAAVDQHPVGFFEAPGALAQGPIGRHQPLPRPRLASSTMSSKSRAKR